VLGRKIIKRQQVIAIFRQALGGLWILGFIGRQEKIESSFSSQATLGHPDLVQVLFAFGLQTLWQFVEHIGRLVHPATLRLRRAKPVKASATGKAIPGFLYSTKLSSFTAYSSLAMRLMVRQKLIKNTPPLSFAHTQLSSITLYRSVRLPCVRSLSSYVLKLLDASQACRLGWSQDLPVLAQVASMHAWGL
jgi:hypothetical protein